MELDIWVILLLCCVYFMAGFIDSVAGGGGLLTIPAFLLTGVPAEMALGTNKLASLTGMFASLATYMRSGLVLWRLTLLGIPVGVFASMAGSYTLLLFDSTTIGKIVVFLLPLGIAATFLSRRKQEKHIEITRFSLSVTMPVLCGLIGFYEGFFGPGAGSFYILALHLAMGIGFVQASATAKAINSSAMISSLAVYAWNGKVILLLAIPLAIASVAGNILGSRLAIKIGPSFVQRVLTVSLTLLFFSLIWKFYVATA